MKVVLFVLWLLCGLSPGERKKTLIRQFRIFRVYSALFDRVLQNQSQIGTIFNWVSKQRPKLTLRPIRAKEKITTNWREISKVKTG